MPLPRSALVRAARAVTVGASFLFASNAFTQEPAPVLATGTAEAERVILTGEELERVILTGFAYDNLGRFWYVRLIKKF